MEEISDRRLHFNSEEKNETEKKAVIAINLPLKCINIHFLYRVMFLELKPGF